MKTFGSYHQQRLWFIDYFEKDYLYEGSPIYHNISLFFTLNESVEENKIKHSFTKLLEAHEILRTGLIKDDEQIWQHIHNIEDVNIDAMCVAVSDVEDNQETYRKIPLAFDALCKVYYEIEEKQTKIICVIHHAIADRHSLKIIKRDFIKLLQGETIQQEATRTYKDFSNWQNGLSNEDLEALLFFWKSKLRDIQVLYFPTDNEREQVHRYVSKNERFNVPKDALVKFCTENNISLNALILAAYKMALARMSELSDIALGTLMNPRGENSANLVGPMENLVVLRSTINVENTLLDICNTVQDTWNEAVQYKTMPFDKLVSEINPKKDMSRTALFDFLYVFEAYDEANDIKNINNEGWGKYDFNLLAQEGKDTVEFILTYNALYFNENTIKSVRSVLKNLLQSIVQSSNQPLRTIEVITQEEEKELAAITSLRTEKQTTIIDEFYEQASKFPNEDALRWDTGKLSYQKLNEKTNQLAHFLREEYNITTEDKIAVVLSDKTSIITSLMAVLKSGAAYVPINPDYPETRIEFTIEDADCTVVINETFLAENAEKIAKASTKNLEIELNPKNLAYIIYTSGTSGKPKGVLVAHQNVTNLLAACFEQIQVSEKDNWLFFHSYCFDFSVWEIFGGLLSGGTVLLVDEETKKDTTKLAALMAKLEITIFSQTPSSFYNFIDVATEKLNALRYVIFGGEALNPLKLADWAGENPDVELINMYGITETTVHVTYKKLTKEDLAKATSTVGKPLSFAKCYILNQQQQLVPYGRPGELYVSGYGVARGYLNREALTKEKFLLKEIAGVEERLYRTGDVVRYLPNNELEYLGRIDDQVKIRGYRIELDEIKKQIETLSGVKQAAAMIFDHQDGDKSIVSYVAVTNAITEADVRAHLSTKLPEYMVPTFIIVMDEIPLNANDKIDKTKLPSPLDIHTHSAQEIIPPANETEKTLVAIWKEILEIESFGIKHNFFEIGGHSLKATKLMTQIHKNTGVKIQLKDIFENPTIQEQARFIQLQDNANFIEIPTIEVAANYPVSNSQYRLWIISQTEEGSIAYNMPSQIELSGSYDIDYFSKAIQAVITRHEILRTVFLETNTGEIRQRIIPAEAFEFAIDFHDFTAQENPKNEANAYIAEDSYLPFDLATGPLLRVSLLKIAEETFVFYYNMHHIISDGWSMEVLSRDVIAYYNAFTENKKLELPTLNIQYKEYASWQRSQRNEEGQKTHKDYWLATLQKDLPVIDLPSQQQRPTIKTYNGSGLQTYISKEITTSLKQIIRDTKGSLHTGLLSIWNIILHKYTGLTDITLGSPISGREHADLENQIGFYVNTLALRNQINVEENFTSFLKKVHQNTLTAFEHQAFTIDQIIEELQIENDPSRNALFDILLVLQNKNEALNDIKLSETAISKIHTTRGKVAKYDLEIIVDEVGDYLALQINYNTDVYDAEMLKGLMENFKNLLQTIVSNPMTTIKDMEYIAAAEKHKILTDFNATKRIYPKDKNIIQLFKEQVQKTPEKIALSFQDVAITYQELDTLSDQFAHFLQANYQIEKQTIVGIKLPRSQWQIISLLSVLKLEASYAPIDYKYPQDRIDFIIDDCNCTVVIDETVISDFNTEKNNSNQTLKTSNSKPDDIVYIMYTSGSTGMPKGVKVTHQNIIRLVKETNFYSFSEKDSLLSTGSFSFDATTFEFFGTLLNGGCLVIPTYEGLMNADLLSEEIKKKNVNIMWFTAGWFNQLVDAASDLFQPLKTIVVGGDKLSSTHIAKIRTQYPALEIINGYGPTENTTFSLTYAITEVAENIPIGSPIANSTAYILDAFQNIVPVGVIGEIYLGGDGVSKGYLNNPELTQQKFVENPFKKGETLYKTGDLGRWLPNGVVEFMGRTDDQLKIRGHRVELGEVERRLLQKPSLDKAAVLAKKDAQGNYYLIAYFVASTKEMVSEIRAYLSQYLPIYMIPSAYIQLDTMPLTANGKVDRAQLASIDHEKHIIKDEYVAPITTQEALLCTVWENVLKRSPIGLKDNFYNLGGDSIKCIQIVSRLKQEGYSLKVEEILRYPIVGELVKFMKHDQTTVDQSEVTGGVVLTPIQHYFFKNTHIKNKNHYNQSVFLKITKHIDHQILVTCLQKLSVHHDALRMNFVKNDTTWNQLNLSETQATFHATYHDITTIENPQHEMQRIGSQTQESMTIEDSTLCKAVHFKLKDHDMLFLTIHHLVVDGVSWRILLEDLSTLYQQNEEGIAMKLPSKTHSFQHWAEVQKSVATSKQMLDEELYWDEICSKNVHPIPFDKQPKNTFYALDGFAGFGLDKNMTELLQTNVHNAYSTEINDILIASFGLAIRDVFETSETLLQMEGHGREAIADTIDISRTVGWFTSIYPFVLEHSNQDQLEVLVKTKAALRKVPKKGIGYGMLAHLNANETLTYLPGAVFNYLGDFGSHVGNKETPIFEYASERLGEDLSPKNGFDCPVAITGMMSYNELSIEITYASQYYETATMQKLSERYKHHLESLIMELSAIKAKQLTPSDVTFKGLSNRNLKELNKNNNVEDIYELSPLQQGMFYHWLSEKESSAYLEQVSYRLTSKNLNIEHVKKAYNQLVDRYAILRTRFTNDYGGTSLQIVYKSTIGNFEYQHIDASIEAINTQVENIKLEELRKGFNLEKDFSQMRLRVVKLQNDEYEFIWNFHHILMDGWCISILVNDFYKLLLNIESKNTTPLPAPKPYADYLAWLENSDKEEPLTYWKNYLNGYDSLASVPFKKNGIKQNAEKFSRKEIQITGDLLAKINEICHEQNITQNTFMQVVWGYLLSRYNDVQDVVFGAVVSGRPGELDGVEEMVGLFINTIPVRMSYTDNDTPVSILQKMHQKDIDSKPYHYLNLSEVQAESTLGMDLLDHIMVFENYPVQELIKEDIENHKEQELAIAAVDVIEQTNYDLDVTVGISEQELTVHFNYNEHVYDATGIETLSKHLQNVITRFATQKAEVLQEFDFISETEKHELLNTFNEYNIAYPKNETILDVFEARVAANPNEIAVIFENKKLTFSELDTLSNQFAQYLKANFDVNTGSFVGIKLERSEWVIVSIFAILKTGSTYIPIDTAYPEERIAYIENDSQCQLCIDEEILQQFKTTKKKYSSEKLEIQRSSDALAYIIYTSGSTGYPKGVQVTHASVVNIYYGWKTAYNLEDFKVTLLQLASFSFDMSVADICRSILTGGTMVICGNDTKLDTLSLCNLITENNVSVFEGTPSFVMPLMRHIHKEKVDVSHLKMIILGAESLNLNDFEFLMLEFGHNSRVINSYGVTEATIDSTYYECEVDTNHSMSTTTPIGIPFPNVQLYVLDTKQQLVPKGVIGELYIGGVGVANGYLNRPELTKEKFIVNPFVKGGKLYKTGDMARWLPNGTLEFLGREDDQVKIRGYRIELGEIEYQIQQYNSVKDIIVLAKQGKHDYKELIAYFTAENQVDVQELRDFLSAAIPSYMLPSYYVQLEKMPLSPNGKVAKNALPTVFGENANREDVIAPRTPEETALVSVWNTVLKFENISVKDSFYNLGGDSIKSIQVVARLKQLGYSLKVEQILRNPILEDLANFVVKNTRIIDQSPVSGEVMLTPIQHYFFTDESIVEKHHHNMSVLLKSTNAIDMQLLEQCIQKLVTHHDALRMNFRKEDGVWKQYNQGISGKHYKIVSHDLRNASDELKALHELGNTIQSTIDIVNGPLFHIGHIKLSDGDRLILAMHHLVVDGISWRILLEDLTGLYEAGMYNTEYELMLKTDSFQNWAFAQKDYAHSKTINKEYAYWDALCNQQIPMLPVDHTEAATGIYHHNKEVALTLDENITEKLQTQIHEVYNTDVNDILLTGLSLAIKDTFHVQQCVIKLEGHGREEIIEDMDISKTVGWFSSEYPVVLDVANIKHSIDALVQTKENLRKIPNKGIGYGILRYLRDDFKGTLNPSIIFNYLGDFGTNVGGTSMENDAKPIFEYASEAFGLDSDPKNGQEELLDIYGVLASNQLSLHLRYSEAVFNADTIHTLTENYKKHLVAIIETLSEISIQHLTPSDLTYKKLSIDDLNIINKNNDIEDVYPLSPLQQGMFYNWSLDPTSSAYFEQISYRLTTSELQMESIKKAYDALIQRHTILRTGFTNEYGGTILQIVYKIVPNSFSFEMVPDDVDVKAYITKQKQDDIAKGFNLFDKGQMRLKVLVLGKNNYEFIWSHHHILMDGWCMSTLINDFYLILNEVCTGISSQLPAPVPYATYIDWINKIEEKESLDFWKKYLKGYENVAEIPFLCKEQSQTYKRRQEKLVVDLEVVKNIQATCTKLNITQNTFIQTVWGCLIAKYNNTSDAVFGAVVSGRPGDLVGIEEMIGLFINTIPVRIKYNENETPESLLRRNHKEFIDCNPHHYMNLSEVQAQSALGMDLIDHVMIFENYPIQDIIEEDINSNKNDSSVGLAIEAIDLFDQINYDFSIVVHPGEEELEIYFDYNANMYDSHAIRDLTEHYHQLLKLFCETPREKINHLSYVNDTEKIALEHMCNGAKVAISQHETFIDLFEKQVQQNGQNIALYTNNNKFSYNEIHKTSNEFAVFINEHFQLPEEAIIGINLARSEWSLISVLAIFKVGAAFLPIDPEYPQERIEYLLNDSKCSYVITEELIEEFNAKRNQYEGTSCRTKISGANLAYVIYTSGSTGMPKGVMIEHAGMLNHMHAMVAALELDTHSIIVQNAPSTFDISIWQLLNSLIVGGATSIYEKETILNPQQFLERVQREKVTTLQVVPSYLKPLLQIETDLQQSYLSNVQYLLVTGEAVSKELIKAWFQKYPNIQLVNAYGPAEASDDITLHFMDSVPESSNIPIGKPIQNMSVFVLDDHLQLCGKNVIGEICVAGIGLGRGYLHRETLTAEKFVKNPFDNGEYLYKTGDLGRWLSDGTLEFHGRIDDQVKIHGFRVELAEIEYQLMQHIDIEQAVVIVKEDESGNKELAASIISEKTIDISELRKYLSKRLPNFMCPAFIVQLEKLPLSANGKIDKKALATIADAETNINADYIPPQNETEEKLVKILAQELNKDEQTISVTDNFFDIGMTSIKLLKVMHSINKAFEIKIKPRELFEFSNVSELVQNVFISEETVEEEINEEEVVDVLQDIDDFLSEIE